MSSTRQLLEQHTLEDLFTLVYVLIDDYLKTSVQHARFTLPASNKQKASYAEIMTISALGELLGQADAGAWFLLVKRDHTDLFPSLPDVTRYYRVARNLERVWADLALCLANIVEDDTVYVVDSKPIPVCKGARFKHPRAMSEAARGFSTLGPVYGFKLHAVVNNARMIVRFAVVAANEADVTVARALLNPETDELERVLGDRAYLGCGLWCPSKSNALHPKPWTAWMDAARKLVETVFSSLTRVQHLVLGQLNSFWSVRSSVCRKVAAHNLALWLGL
jgi:Transposase DDE domain